MAYATQADITNLGLPPEALGDLTPTQVSEVLQKTSDFADSFFRARYGQTAVPLQAWDSSVTDAVAQIAAMRLLRLRGYSPDSTADQRFKQASDESIEWLNKVQRQQAHPLVTLAQNQAPPLAPLLRTKALRGW